MTVENVVKVEEGVYLLNGSTKIMNIGFEDEHFVFDIDYDEGMIGEAGAIELCNQFLKEAIEEEIKKYKGEKRTRAKAAQTAGI